MAPGAKLITKAGGDVGQDHLIENDSFYIGRDPSNNLVLAEDAVSRNHAHLFQQGDTFFLEDMHSTNGSFVNGKRVRRKQKLQDGDLVTIGEGNVFEFKFVEKKMESALADVTSEPQEGIIDDREDSSNEEEIQAKDLTKTKTKANAIIQFFSRFPTWALVLFISISFLILFCLIPFVVIEVTDQWCNLFSGFFNAMSPGVCP